MAGTLLYEKNSYFEYFRLGDSHYDLVKSLKTMHRIM